jgi:hypothetical protein
MYKGLLGDCFLLRIAAGQEKPKHVLIDCGILMGIKDADKTMEKVAENIRETTDGFVDVLVLTHEHWDHLSGFRLAQEVFDRIAFSALWLAWTEDPNDKQAQDLRANMAGQRLAVAALARVVKRIEDDPFAAAPDGAAKGLEAFIGELADVPLATAQAQAETQGLAAAKATASKVAVTRQIIDRLVEQVEANGDGRVRYLEPGNVLERADGAPLRTYVLGPPRNTKRLTKDRPSAGAAKETYLATAKVNERALLRMAGIPVDQGSSADDGSVEQPDLTDSSPFARSHRQLTQTRVDNELAGRPSSGDALPEATRAFLKAYYDTASIDRRIDSEWLRCGGALALKLDSDTNNTSLVLAFELPNCDVLLFAADAQVGNWLSWHDQDYFPADGKKVTASDLLSRTVLYKVGHHGSHNATLRKEGLEKMTHQDLVAMLPTVETDALRQGAKGWKMPNPELYPKLLQRTQGRLLRGDADKGKDPKGVPLTNDPRFLDRAADCALYVEYRVSGRGGPPQPPAMTPEAQLEATH